MADRLSVPLSHPLPPPSSPPSPHPPRPHAQRAEGDMLRERAGMMAALRGLGRDQRERLFASLGVRGTKRKARLVSQLWTSVMAPEDSAVVVLLLNEGTLDRKTRFVHFSSLYAMASSTEGGQGYGDGYADAAGEDDASGAPVIPVIRDDDDDDDGDDEDGDGEDGGMGCA